MRERWSVQQARVHRWSRFPAVWIHRQQLRIVLELGAPLARTARWCTSVSMMSANGYRAVLGLIILLHQWVIPFDTDLTSGSARLPDLPSRSTLTCSPDRPWLPDLTSGSALTRPPACNIVGTSHPVRNVKLSRAHRVCQSFFCLPWCKARYASHVPTSWVCLYKAASYGGCSV